jgi:peptide/nickel transport system substrate-binding protein
LFREYPGKFKGEFHMTDNTARRTALRAAAIVAAGLLVASVSACSQSSSGTTPTSITIGLASAPLSLDPAKAQNSSDGQAYTDLAYAPLIDLTSTGKLAPALATSWKYTDSSLTTFQLTLRSGVKFSDGKPLTAALVVKSIERAKKSAGVAAPYAAEIKSEDATNAHTVTLHLVQSNPTIAQVLTQRYLVGSIVGPDGQADPSTLGTTTDGAGPYMIDASATVANDHYTYVPNPYYWDKASVHFKKFTVRVIPNPQTAFNAVKSKQVSYIGGSFSTVDQAKAAGLTVYSALSDWYGVFLLDRGGVVVPALASQKVRQALNYAVDRKAITTSLFGTYGVPTSEISDSAYNADGFDPAYNSHYNYDPAKAKKLLAEAGYPNGFSISIAATATYGDGVEVAQAIASDWEKIGVKTKVQTYNNLGSLATPLVAKQTAALAGNLDVQPMYLESTQLLDPGSGAFNIFGNTDAQLTSLLTKARAQTTTAGIASAWAAVERRVVDLGWFLPVSTGPTQYYAVKSLKGISLSAANFVPDPTAFHF